MTVACRRPQPVFMPASQIGFRAHQLAVANGAPGRHVFPTTVSVTEITGSESFVHVHYGSADWVAVLEGIHEYEPGQGLNAALDPDNLFVFDTAGRLVASPSNAFSAEAQSALRDASKKSSRA